MKDQESRYRFHIRLPEDPHPTSKHGKMLKTAAGQASLDSVEMYRSHRTVGPTSSVLGVFEFLGLRAEPAAVGTAIAAAATLGPVSAMPNQRRLRQGWYGCTTHRGPHQRHSLDNRSHSQVQPENHNL
eukprot:CAMPEP_0172784418 /NCGR_PEP_ID=MMETSP1074-20121228/204930_1 /TAXON_ID=2916 /ORGANISM="Ceratium fusus, Strain PA161109" /LENGTH=127 /DNA_ID=CAMNT_0013621421 /DNA_START=907 /DNA_END=1291 /DNA_ORIENTATION=-